MRTTALCFPGKPKRRHEIGRVGSILLHFSNRLELIGWSIDVGVVVEEFVLVARLSFGLLISVSVVLTAYFGMAAWRLSGDYQNESARSWPPSQVVKAQEP